MKSGAMYILEHQIPVIVGDGFTFSIEEVQGNINITISSFS